MCVCICQYVAFCIRNKTLAECIPFIFFLAAYWQNRVIVFGCHITAEFCQELGD